MRSRWSQSLCGTASGVGVATLLACVGPPDQATQGTLRVALADAPACGFDQVNVTVERVRVHQSSSAAANDIGWNDIRLDPARRIDLLTLTNGVLLNLGQTALPAGQYQQLRLVLAADPASGAPANSVLPTGGSETALQTPSAAQSGIKLIHQFAVQAGELVDLVLDFNACKSIVALVDGGYQLKPVIQVIPVKVSGAITGTLATSISGTAVAQAVISAQNSGDVLRATVPDSAGRYTLSPVDSSRSPYELVITMPGAATAVVSGVPVTTGSTTNVPAITLSAGSTLATVSGTVGPAASLPATLRPLQAVGALSNVEVASRNTSDAGAYSMTLPKAAAQLSGYSPSSLSFSNFATASSAGKYTIEAADVNGAVNSTAPTVDISSGDAAVNFTFP